MKKISNSMKKSQKQQKFVLDLTGKRRDNIHPEEKVKRHITLD